MHRIIKKVHIYTGLLNFTALMVFGIAGIVATIHGSAEGARYFVNPEYVDFVAPPNASDKQLAELVRKHLGLSLHWPIPSFAIRRNPAGVLVLDYYSVNGVRRATVLEGENRLRVEQRPNDLGRFVNNLHTTTMAARHPDWRVRAWTYYNEFAIWSLIGMSLSGVYLWLASRPGHRWAQASFAVGSGVFLLLYAVTR